MWLIKNVLSKLSLVLLLILFNLAVDNPVAFAAPGDLDTTFGDGGIVVTDINGVVNLGQAMLIQPDGKIVVVGNTTTDQASDFAVARYNSDGSLDSTFGSGGIVVTAVSSRTDFGRSIALQTDGKILVAGVSGSATYDFAIVRYNTDGSLDTSFDTDGIVTTDMMAHDYGYSVTIQPDGKILLAGYSLIAAYNEFFILRYNEDGSLDNTFGNNGVVTQDIGGYNDYCYCVAVQADGKIIAVGSSDDNLGPQTSSLSMVRLHSNGSLDNGFGTNGTVMEKMDNRFNVGQSIAFQSDGKIIVAGYCSGDYDLTDIAVVRFNSDGTLDTDFGTDGVVITGLENNRERGYSVVVQSDGKIVVAGEASEKTENYVSFAILRYNHDGTLDTTFGKEGFVRTICGDPWYPDAGRSVMLQSDNKIVVAGYSDIRDFAVARYQNKYLLDVTKNGDGTGAVASEPAGIDCGGDCSEEVNLGDTYTLTATPDAGHALEGWSGADCPGNHTCTITVDKDYHITAVFNPDSDGDGVTDNTENGGPNNGDANMDGIPDSGQVEVTTFKNINDQYVTLVSNNGNVLGNVTARINPSPGNSPSEATFPEGFFGFVVEGITPGGSAIVDLILHQTSSAPTTVYKYGPTLDNQVNHWYEFLFDNGTGARLLENGGKTVIQYHFQDGGRGDGDLAANGVIVDPCGPGLKDLGGGGSGSESGSGGCFILTIH